MEQKNQTINALNKAIEIATDINVDPVELSEYLSLKDEDDFYIGDYRFIRDDIIDWIMEADFIEKPFLLGCYYVRIITASTKLSHDLVEYLQEKYLYDLLGKQIIHMDGLTDMKEEIINNMGYGHHFTAEGSEQHKTKINGNIWYYFKVY